MSHCPRASRVPYFLNKNNSRLSDGSIPGIFFSEGPTWREQRRFALSALRSLGFGKASMQGAVAEEAADLCGRLEAAGAHPVDMTGQFNVSVLSVMWRIVRLVLFQLDWQNGNGFSLILDVK